MYNPHREHKETVEIEGTIPLQAFDCKGKGILTVNLMEDGKICSIFDVTLLPTDILLSSSEKESR